MYMLALNDMRGAHVEQVQPIFRADTKEALKVFVGSQLVPPYEDVQARERMDEDGVMQVHDTYSWSKIFRKGGPLEWCNPPDPTDDNENYILVREEDEFVRAVMVDYEKQVRENFQRSVLSVPLVPVVPT